MKVDTLRLRLPSIHDLTSTAVTAFAYKQAGVWHVGEPTSLTTILSQYQPRLLEVGLHPADTTLVTTSMPPLSEKHRRTAVLAQIEPLALDDVDQLSIAYGPRSPSGDVTLAWLPRESLAYVHDVLQGQGVVLPALRFYPAPFFWPCPTPAKPAHLLINGR
ncbi:hypothetical protein L1889_10395 [Paenalcaligenes niemegkensis]|uniref:hypothetical protein n=1 Tax=Paenalcaligenes niemegkensis TaxID=2895469 RepID=UPI001EE9ADD7|nr:hypothetical protein [Paenalcaligenes niemegkensis]MCQ9617062.1 hypothetical protein [Paenalcaligenes niemegkensis]